MFWRWRWRCIFEHPTEEHVLRSRTRCSLAPSVGENPGQRAENIYSAGGTTYSAPQYSAPVGDALRTEVLTLRRHSAPTRRNRR
jgi:hypothetical protein